LREVEPRAIRRAESHLVAGPGATLFRRSWQPPTPERALLFVHGYAEHSGRYETAGAWFAARGCAVHAYDQRGHGRSQGARGHVRSFGDFLDDLDTLAARVREEHPGLPLFAVGHSMGGLVVASWLTERGPALRGAVTSGAALSLAGVPSGARRRALRILRGVAPRLALRRPIATDLLSRDPEVGRAYLEDPLVFQRMTVSLAAEIFDAAQRVLPQAHAVRVPLLLLHGEEDRLCLPQGSRSFFEGLGTAGSDLRLYPGLRHEIFNEPEREKVFGDLLDWVRKREAGA
jgi:alpha-beta hydrolase superfamily lysophospholipase